MSNNENFENQNSEDEITQKVQEMSNTENIDDLLDEKESSNQDGTYVLVGKDLAHSAEIIKKEEELVSAICLDTDDEVVGMDENKDNFEEVNLEDTIKETKEKNNYIKYSFGLVGLAAVVIAIIITITINLSDKKNNVIIGERVNNTPTPKATILQNDSDDEKDVTEVLATDGETVADIVDNVMPSIVTISCIVEQQYNFFGNTYSEDSEGSGSGIIIGQNDKQVLIATNNHVIEGASTVMITFNDGKEVKAEIKLNVIAE